MTMFSTALSPIQQYRQVGVTTDVAQASPHQLVMLLFDATLASVLQARHAIETGDLPTKCATIGRAMRLIDEGLKSALQSQADPAMAANLAALYEHMVARLFHANLHGDIEALDEVARLLGELRAAWAAIAPPPPAPTQRLGKVLA